ncbi:hypothetical protein HDU85_005072 [Gaertneriomyces sp. JEL0708]|nr:hypothetical protein HDU85_005072 [Gaertneriomyces sp. JEL0708]
MSFRGYEEEHLFTDCVVEVSSESGSEAGDPPPINPVDLAYVKNKMAQDLFDPVMFGRRCYWDENDRSRAQSYIHDCVKATIDELNKQQTTKHKLKMVARNVARLQTYDWNSPSGPWGKYWEAVEIKAKMRHNSPKRLAEADEALTENTKRVRNANKGTQPKGDDWRSALKSQIWSFIPRLADTTTTDSWRESLIEIGKQFDTTGEILIDLRTSSPQLHSLSMEMIEKYGESLDQRFEVLPPEARSLLERIFEGLENVDVRMWEESVNKLEQPDSQPLANILRMVRQTLPVFCRAFARDNNPLKSRETLEAEHLGTYIHPIFREACHRFAYGTVWRHGEASADFFVKRQKADGVAVVKNRDNIPIGYFEGSRPVFGKSKRKADGDKILQNLTSIYSNTVQTLLVTRRRVPDMLMIFGAQAIGLEVVCSVIEYHDHLFLHEFDQAIVPAQSSDALLFIDLYQCIISWALLTGRTVKSINTAQSTKRASRKSHVMAAWMLGGSGSNSVEQPSLDHQEGDEDIEDALEEDEQEATHYASLVDVECLT